MALQKNNQDKVNCMNFSNIEKKNQKKKQNKPLNLIKKHQTTFATFPILGSFYGCPALEGEEMISLSYFPSLIL